MFIHNGGEEEQKGVKSNPTRGRNQRSKAGIYSEGLCPSLDKRKCHSSSACVFLSCIQMNVCASCVLQQINWKVFLSCIWSTWAHLSLAAREVAFFLSLFLHSFLCLFFSHISVLDYLVVIQIKELIVISLVLHALEIHPVSQDTWKRQR